MFIISKETSWTCFATTNEDDIKTQIDVIPTNEDHRFGEQGCKCEPELKYTEGVPMYIHNAFDGRHVLEQAEELLAES